MGFQIFLVANTGSMEPDLKHNDLIWVSKFDFDKLEVDDWIAFEGSVNGRPATITHAIVARIYNVRHYDVDCNADCEADCEVQHYRLVRTSSRTRLEEGTFLGFQTKGINNNSTDPRLVSKDGENNTNRYLGKYSWSSRPVGLVFAFISSPFGLVVIGVNVVGFFVISYLLTAEKKDKEKREEEKESETKKQVDEAAEKLAEMERKLAEAEAEMERKLAEAEAKLKEKE
jgi:signal peptidase I